MIAVITMVALVTGGAVSALKTAVAALMVAALLLVVAENQSKTIIQGF